MEYRLYQLEFLNGVRFGKGNLDSNEITFHSDTLFSALFQEALKLGKEAEFLSSVQDGKIVFSDGFPYIHKSFCVPKPIVQLDTKGKENRGNSSEKKRLKKLKFVPQEYAEEFAKGVFPKECKEKMDDIGKFGMKVSVKLEEGKEPEPYRVSSFHFKEGSGLYFVLRYEDSDDAELFESLMKSLSYAGLGGKKSSGLGRFEYTCRRLPEAMERRFTEKHSRYMLISSALPENEELPLVLESATYNILKRSGFVDSDTYADSHVRKNDRYVFAPGSCFAQPFDGTVIEENNGGRHPVFRYEKALFVGVNV